MILILLWELNVTRILRISGGAEVRSTNVDDGHLGPPLALRVSDAGLVRAQVGGSQGEDRPQALERGRGSEDGVFPMLPDLRGNKPGSIVRLVVVAFVKKTIQRTSSAALLTCDCLLGCATGVAFFAGLPPPPNNEKVPDPPDCFFGVTAFVAAGVAAFLLTT